MNYILSKERVKEYQILKKELKKILNII